MPTPDPAPSVAVKKKILAAAAPIAAEHGWTDRVFDDACTACGVSRDEIAYALPDGVTSLVAAWFEISRDKLKNALKDEPLAEMRIREKVTRGVELWLEGYSEHPGAAMKALDWICVRPLSVMSSPHMIWEIADTVWTGIGDTSTGFTYASKRTTLTAVLASTLAVWRKAPDDREGWKAFLDRRIEDVMAFEKFKAGIKVPRFA